MNENLLYRQMASKISPSPELIENTIKKMENKVLDKTIKKTSKQKYFTAAICTAILAIAIGFLIQPNSVNDILEEENIIAQGNIINNEGIHGDAACRTKLEYFQQLNESEIWQQEKYVPYLPLEILSGYNFEGATVSNNNDHPSMIISYTKGYSYITIVLLPFEETDSSRLVSAADTYKYDICNYTIPLAESVPMELFETMHYPIFLAEELSPEVLELRTLESAYDDDGGGKLHMDFSVLCDDMIIRYNIKGSDLSDVFNMVTSADYFSFHSDLPL